MQLFDISWLAIFKITRAGSFTFIFLPLLLVIRDTLIHKAIEKWILTANLNSLIRTCEGDRWYLNNKHNKTYGMGYGTESITYKIDENPVLYEKLKKYQINRGFHFKLFKLIESKKIMKHNFIAWLTKHYKQADGGNPTPSLRELYYKPTGNR